MKQMWPVTQVETLIAYAVPSNDLDSRPEDDLQVQPDRSRFHVEPVKFHLLLDRQFVPPLDLR